MCVLHIVFHNGIYATSGAQPVLAEGRMSFAEMAKGAGYAEAVRFDDIESFELALDDLLTIEGPVFIELLTEPTGESFKSPNNSPSVHPEGERALPSALASRWPIVSESLQK